MELMSTIQARRSIRKFKSDPVSDQMIRELLEAARLAPSGTNIQPWRFIVMKSAESKAELSKCTPLPFVSSAPVVIACCMDNQALAQRAQRVDELRSTGAFAGTPLDSGYTLKREMDEATANAYLWLNIAIAIDHMTLRAVDLGLGTCWVMMFDRNQLQQTLQLEDRYSIVALLPVGYPDQDPAPRPRLSVDDLILKEM